MVPPDAPAATLDAPDLDREKAVGKGSLMPVIEVIPEAAYRNPTWKGLAYFARDLAMYIATITGLILITNPIATIALWVLGGMVISGLFIVAHDAAHGALFSSKRLNRVVGTIAMLPSWHVYEGWVLGHNRIHHSYTVREGFDFVWHPYTPEQYAAMSRLGRLRHRIEWSWIGAGAYYLREVWWHKMIVGAPPARWAPAIRRDRIIVWSFVGGSSLLLALVGWMQSASVLGAVWLPIKVLVVPFLAFSYIIGSFVHVHHVQPDIRWWKRREWTKFHGQMEGTTVLRARFGLNFFFHWIMVHVPHHVDMRIPMYNLELATDAIKEAFPGVVHDEPLRFRDFVANTRQCRLYDFDAGRWLTYREAAAQRP
ncbi:MAG: fatty acid desaturase [Acidobacteria bacterium]|nr:fatty acid desaturase [Acidobacteriota bacterium]